MPFKKKVKKAEPKVESIKEMLEHVPEKGYLILCDMICCGNVRYFKDDFIAEADAPEWLYKDVNKDGVEKKLAYSQADAVLAWKENITNEINYRTDMLQRADEATKKSLQNQINYYEDKLKAWDAKALPIEEIYRELDLKVLETVR